MSSKKTPAFTRAKERRIKPRHQVEGLLMCVNFVSIYHFNPLSWPHDSNYFHTLFCSDFKLL